MAVASREDTDTWAVGFTTINGQVMPLAMRWNGSGWKTDRPTPRGSLTSLFTDVTIVGDGSPFAVGYRMTAKRQAPAPGHPQGRPALAHHPHRHRQARVASP